MPLAPIGQNNRNDSTIRAGSIVEFEQHGRPVLCSAVSEQKGKWLVKTEEGGECEVPAIRLYLYPPPPPAFTQTALVEIAAQGNKSASSLDLEKIWEHFNSKKREYTVSDLAQVVFGNDTFFSHLSMRRALLSDRIYFKRGKSGFEPRPADQVAELRERAEQERERAEKRERLLEALQRRNCGEQAELPPEIIWLEQIAAVGRAGESHHDAVALFNQVSPQEGPGGGGSGGGGKQAPLEERVFQYLVKIGHFKPDHNLSFLRCRRPEKFDEVIEAETAAVLKDANKPFEADRTDLRGSLTVAIDNENTRDVDDALTLEQIPGGYRLGVHISDVSSRIRPGTELFREALYRASTVYCVDSVTPMLPEQLSEGALSLLADVDRPAISFLFSLNSAGEITERTIVRSIVRVTKRFSYDKVDELLYGEAQTGFSAEDSQMLTKLWDIAAASEARRIGRGATQLPRRELFPELGPNGEIAFVESGEDTPAHRLVGELMILANEAAGLFARDNSIPLAFRGQEPPDQPIEQAVAATPDGPAREYHRRGMLKRSTVTTTPAPHFGLGVQAYSQSTSPIRRAGDLINQEQISSFLVEGKPRFNADDLNKMFEQLEAGLDEVQLIQRQRRRYFLIKHLLATGQTELSGTIVRTDGPRPLIELNGTCSIFIFTPNRGVVQSGDSVTMLDRARNGERIRVRIAKADPRKELLFLDEI